MSIHTAKTPRQFHVAIIGAGIGGLGLAIGLLQQSIPFTIYEAASCYSVVGAGVGLGPNALRAMDMLDSRLRKLYNSIATGNLHHDKDHVIFDCLLAKKGFGIDEGWGQSIGAEVYNRTSAHRKALLDIMTSFIPGSNVKFNKKAVKIEQMDLKVTVEFADGERVTADAVIGCDGGNRGVSRQAVLGERYPDLVHPVYAGKYVYRSLVPMDHATAILGELALDSKIFLGPVRHFLSYPISKGEEANVIAFKHTDEPWIHDQWTKEVSREEMVADFKGHVDDRLVKLLDWAKPIQWSLHHHLDTPTYFSSHVCLLGDSAHSSTPHQAANAGQALEDAVILSYVMGLVDSPLEFSLAFEVYDSIRRPRAQKLVRTSQEAGHIAAMCNEETESDREKIVANYRRRWLWIWEHDLSADIKKADEEFERLRRKS